VTPYVLTIRQNILYYANMYKSRRMYWRFSLIVRSPNYGEPVLFLFFVSLLLDDSMRDFVEKKPRQPARFD
jgi:hypothetical protein